MTSLTYDGESHPAKNSVHVIIMWNKNVFQNGLWITVVIKFFDYDFTTHLIAL